MKRNVLAVVIPALLVAATANAAEVYNKNGNKLDFYGKVDGLHYFSKNDSQNGDQSYARFGLNGETQINDQLTGYGNWEYQIGANNTESDDHNGFTRLGYAGIKSANYGSLDYGRNYGVIYDVGGYTDVLPEFGGDAVSHTDNFMDGRTNGVLTYRNNNFFGLVDGLNLALQYQGKNSNRTNVLEENGDGFGTSLSYTLADGISAVAALSSSLTTSNQQAVGAGHRAETYAGGLRYNANNLYLATIYSQGHNATGFGDGAKKIAGTYGVARSTKNFEAVAQYAFDFGLTPSIAYLQSKGDGVGSYDSQDLLKYIDLGSTYNFNKNLSTYVDYKINLLNDNTFTQATGTNTDNVVGAGLVYQF